MKVLEPEELAEWRENHPDRVIVEPKPRDKVGDDESAEQVDEDTAAWDTPAPSFIRSGSSQEVFLRLVDRLTQGYRDVARYLEGLPNVQSELTSSQVDAWAREKAEAAVRRVYADIKPVRSDLAEVADGNTG